MKTKLKKILFGNFIFLFSLFLILIINIALLYFPLTNVFGFEFSFVNAILITFLAGITSISHFRKELNKSIIYFFYFGILFLIIPLFITLINSFFGYSCSIIDGFLFYFVITVPSYFIGISLGLVMFSISKKYNYVFFIFLYILILFIPIAEFYLNPQVFFFNPIFGYFPGTIYDESISISTKLVLYRALNLTFFISIFIILINRFDIKKYTHLILAGFLFISLIFLFLSPQFCFSTTKKSLSDHLNKRIETEHFVIHYPKSLGKKEIKKISIYHEFYYSRLTIFFKLKIKNKIDSFVFENNTDKGDYFGSANADVAKPWLDQIYTTTESYNYSLEHEIAHIFSAGFGTTIFKVADGINPAMIEGIAVAASPFYNENTIDYMAALALTNGYKVDIKKLFVGANFFTQNSSLSYIYSGSFIKYLIEKYGISQFKLYYSNSDFEKIYKINFEEVKDGYYNYLKTIETKQDSSKAKYYFGRQTIFTRVCPRYVSKTLDDASQAFIDKDYNLSIEKYSEILEKTDNYFALIGYTNVTLELNKINNAINKIEGNLRNYLNTSYYYNLQFKLADLYSLSDYKNKADSLYKEIITENPNNWLVYLSKQRLYLLNNTLIIKDYLNNSSKENYNLFLEIINKKNINILLPTAIRLAIITESKYEIFYENLKDIFISENLNNSFVLNYLSMYMLDNFDFLNAEKMLNKVIRLNKNKYNVSLLNYNLEKISWMKEHFKKF